MSDRLSAVVVAAGRSERFQKELSGETSRPKIFVEWSGKPLIRHTIEALLVLEPVETVLVTQRENFDDFAEIFDDLIGCYSIRWTEGGRRRQDSVRLGLQSLKPCDRVLIHDGARPFLNPGWLKKLNELSVNEEGLIPGTAVVETLKRKSPDGFVAETVNRSEFFRAQTPQFFKYDLIRELHEKVANVSKEFTDDAAILEHFGRRVRLVDGAPENIKVTVPEDLRSRGVHV